MGNVGSVGSGSAGYVENLELAEPDEQTEARRYSEPPRTETEAVPIYRRIGSIRLPGGGAAAEPGADNGVEAAMRKYGLHEADVGKFTERGPQAIDRMQYLKEKYAASDNEKNKIEKDEKETQKSKNKSSYFNLMSWRRKAYGKSSDLKLTVALPETMSLKAKKVIQEIENYRKNTGIHIPLNTYKGFFEKHGLPMPFDVKPGSDLDDESVNMIPLNEGRESNSLKTEKLYQSFVLDGYDFDKSKEHEDGQGPKSMQFSSEGKHRRAAFNRIFDQLAIPDKYRYVPEDSDDSGF